MMVVRGILMGLVMSLAATAVPAHAAAPEASGQVHRQAAKANWETIKEWKHGVVRGCRSKWDGDSFYLQVQLVNRADHGLRGATLGERSANYPPWYNQESALIAPGGRATLEEVNFGELPRDVELRAKVSSPNKVSGWSKVLRVDRLNVC